MASPVIKIVPQGARVELCGLVRRAALLRRVKMSMRLSLSIVCAVLFLAYFDPFASAGSFFRLRSEPPVPVPHQVATPFCPEPPNAAESVLLASQSPVVLAGRLRQRVSLAGSQPSDETDHLFNLSVLVTMQYKTAGVQSAVDGVITVGVFFTPSHNSNGGPGCLDAFYPNSKYIFFLRHSDDRSKFFELTGRPATYTEELEHIIFAQQCSKCYAPIVNSLSNQQVKHGDRLSVTCSASGYPVPQIVWIKNGQSINLVDKGVHIENVELPDGKTESLLEIVKLVRVDAGEYECRAKNPLGTASAKFALQVTQTEKEEQQLMSTELVPCTEEQRYYCMNGGQCYMFKADRDVFQCRCPQQYFGDRCNFHVFGLLPYGEARDANLESMFKEISHEIIAHLTWSIWGSFALLAALLLFVIIKKHERLSKKSPRKQKAISTSSPKVMKNKNGALSNPLIHVSESNHILTPSNDMNRLDTGVTSVMHEMEYLRPTNNQRTDRMPYTIHAGTLRPSMNKEPVYPYPTCIHADSGLETDSGSIIPYSSTLHKKPTWNVYEENSQTYPTAEFSHTFGTHLAPRASLDCNMSQRSPCPTIRPFVAQMTGSTTSHTKPLL